MGAPSGMNASAFLRNKQKKKSKTKKEKKEEVSKPQRQSSRSRSRERKKREEEGKTKSRETGRNSKSPRKTQNSEYWKQGESEMSDSNMTSGMSMGHKVGLGDLEQETAE